MHTQTKYFKFSVIYSYHFYNQLSKIISKFQQIIIFPIILVFSKYYTFAVATYLFTNA